MSLVLVIVLGYFYTGGFEEVFQMAEERGRIELLKYEMTKTKTNNKTNFVLFLHSLDPNPTTRHTVFSVVIGGFFYWTSLLCTNQASVQKCMSLKSRSKSSLALVLSIFGNQKQKTNPIPKTIFF